MRLHVVAFVLPVALLGGVRVATQPEDDMRTVALADPIIRAAMEKDRIPGVALSVVHNGRVLAARGYGVADTAQTRPVTADTVFRIGSISKVFTALAVMQLVDRELLRLEDDVNRHLTQLRVGDRFGEPVRVWHLLTHTAGFDQRFMGREGARAGDAFSLATFLENNLVRIRPPGKVASYDTYGITLAGHLVEQVSRLPFEVYLRRQLFEPLGMTRTNVGSPLPGSRAETAVGYRLAGSTTEAQAWEHYRSTPASSINSSANDMARFMVAVLDEGRSGAHQLWSPATGRRIQSRQFQNGPSGGFAYGFWDEVRNGRRVIFHGGNMNGYETEMVLVPELEFGYFVAYNRDGRPFPTLRGELNRAVLEELAPPTSEAAHAQARVQIPLARFAGTYADAAYCHTCYENESEGNMSAFPVEAEPDGGTLRFSGRAWIPVGPLEFVEQGGTRRARFRENVRGEILDFAMSHRTYEKLGDRLLDEALGMRRDATLPSPFEARVYRLTNEPVRAAAAYRTLIARRPWDGVLHHYLGVVLLEANQPGEAAEALARAAECEQWPSPTGYLLAVAHARNQQPQLALDALEKAVEAGFRDAARMERDPAFAGIRATDRYRAVLQKLTGKAPQ